ncbi:MAG: hypothetical protein A2Y81_06250 [Nitrospirae bacterium RBG_13_43_8]|nr:MAG: hypothetical protein A2Y81_06250 [Nitrospirae bacterium RBG_13_43_8]
MIIKKRDSKQAEIDELTTLLSVSLPENKKFLIDRELRSIKSGDRGEKDAAYFIDFHFASSKRWAVIHDLRLEYRDKVAQIDHLLISRLFDIYLLESKNVSYGLKITDTGEFLVNYGKNYVAIESPIEQNKRHQIVLEQVIKKYDIMPKRLGITITPSFYCYVLVSPKSRVVRPNKARFDTSMVIKTDTLRSAIDKRVDKMNAISALTTASKMSSFEAVVKLAKRLTALHKPFKTDYWKRFGIEDAGRFQSSKPFYCFKCKKLIDGQVAKSCWDNKQRFHGRAYCFDCQKAFSAQR